jgi:hypothetical protein
MTQALTSVIPDRRLRRLIAGAFSVLLLTSEMPGQTPMDLALARFLGTDPHSFALDLERHRPPAITGNLKAHILDSLPAEGQVKELKQSDRRKLASLEQVLRVHQRQSVYEVKVIAVPQAFVGLHARAVVLISETALNFLDTEELQAMVAHEIGHEYVWAQYEKAKALKDHRLVQELELYCDGVAVLTLSKTGIDPSRLLTGLEKIGRFNRRRFGRALDEDYYISLTERKKFAQAVTAWGARVNLAEPVGPPAGSRP